jgi:hypothetical protein
MGVVTTFTGYLRSDLSSDAWRIADCTKWQRARQSGAASGLPAARKPVGDTSNTLTPSGEPPPFVGPERFAGTVFKLPTGHNPPHPGE